MSNRTITWPNGKKSAAMVSIELDGELMWILIDPTNAARPKTLSMGTYGLLRGLPRMLASLAARKMHATFFVPGLMAERYPAAIKTVSDAGHEIALHGYAHENFGLLTPAEQREAVQKGVDALSGLLGVRPAGFRLPEGNMTPETLGILNEFGFEYDASMVDDDLPYQTVIDGKKAPLIEIPMRWELQDFPYFAFNFFPPFPLGECRPAGYAEAMDVWLTEMAGYEQMGLCYVIKFDPQTIGSPARIEMFDQVLDEILARDMWAATGKEIADHYRAFSSS